MGWCPARSDGVFKRYCFLVLWNRCRRFDRPSTLCITRRQHQSRKGRLIHVRMIILLIGRRAIEASKETACSERPAERICHIPLRQGAVIVVARVSVFDFAFLFMLRRSRFGRDGRRQKVSRQLHGTLINSDRLCLYAIRAYRSCEVSRRLCCNSLGPRRQECSLGRLGA
jgi:hypothetical protein